MRKTEEDDDDDDGEGERLQEWLSAGKKSWYSIESFSSLRKNSSTTRMKFNVKTSMKEGKKTEDV